MPIPSFSSALRRAIAPRWAALGEVPLGTGNAAEDLAHLRLVDGEGKGQAIPELLGRLRAVAGEKTRSVGIEPAARLGEPAGHGAVRERHLRSDTVGVATRDHPFVVVQLRLREVTATGLNPRPLNGEAVTTQP